VIGVDAEKKEPVGDFETAGRARGWKSDPAQS
jgi:hypothetical protein